MELKNISLIAHRVFKLIVYRPNGWWRILLNQFMRIVLKSSYVPAYPTYLIIEPTNFCDQRCPTCETGSYKLGRDRGMMPFETYTKIIDNIGKKANFIDLYMMGESFLHKDIYKMIHYARKNNLFVRIDTNGLAVDVEKILDSDLNEIQFQIGGITQETHTKYRKGGNVELVFDKVRRLVKLRDKNKSKHPVIKMGLIIMKHNESELGKFKEIAYSLGVDGAVEVAGGVRTAEQAQEFLPLNPKYRKYDEDLLRKGIIQRRYTGPCRFPWNSVMITWDGDVHFCPKDWDGKYVMGNIHIEDFSKIWNKANYRKLRKMLIEKGNCLEMCHYCPGYGANNWMYYFDETKDKYRDRMLNWRND